MKIRFVILMMFLAVLPPPAVSQQAAAPMSKDQVMSVVASGMDNTALAQKIEERGIDFDLTDDYLQALRAAGAQEVIIKALRTVKPSPMSRDQLLLLVADGMGSEGAAAVVKELGLDFMPDDKFLEVLRHLGADDALIAVVREAKPAEVQRHLTRAAEFEQKHEWKEAEQEYRAALALLPGDTELLQKAESAAKHREGPQFKLVKRFDHPGPLYICSSRQMAISPDGRWLAWSDCESLDIWEVATGERMPSPPARGTFAFSPDGRWLAALAKDFAGVGVWEVTSGREVERIPGGRPLAMQFSPDGRRLAFGGMDDGTVRLLDPGSGKEVFRLTALASAGGSGAKRWINWLTFSPDGRLLASQGDHSTIKLWETATGKEVRVLEGFRGVAYSAAFSPDGRWMASTNDDRGVFLWEVATGKLVRTLYDDQAYRGDVAFTPDGDWLGWCQTSGLTLWDMVTGRKLGELDVRGGVGSLGFSLDGKWLAGISGWNVYLWQRQD